jgi:hypothetical protein
MPQDDLTTEQLMERARETVRQMSPEEKAKLREQIKQSETRKECKPKI